MELFSPAATVLALSFVIDYHSSLTSGDAAMKPSLNNTVNHLRWNETLQKRVAIIPHVCGLTKVVVTPLNRGKDVFKGDNDLNDDGNDDKHLDKILGGSYVTYGEFPWQAAILFSNEYICSGSIISEFWVISAAHCFRNNDTPSYTIVVGNQRLGYQDSHEATFQVNTIISHEKFGIPRFDNDIALVKIQATRDGRGIRFNDYVQPICLPYSIEAPPVGVEVTTTGWGITAKDGEPSTILKKAILTIIPNDVCNRVLGNITSPRIFCAFNLKRESQLCSGDSGGPSAYLQGAFAVLIGVSATSSACQEPVLPSGLSSAPAHRDWIDKTIRIHSKTCEGVMPVRPLGGG